MIRMLDAQLVARELTSRYAPIRAVTLISRVLQKALFAGRGDEVIFWALVHAHFRGEGVKRAMRTQLQDFCKEISVADSDP